MAVTDPAVMGWVDAHAHWLHTALPLAGALIVVVTGKWLAIRIDAKRQAQEPAIDLAAGDAGSKRD
jgi:hypothetical protein